MTASTRWIDHLNGLAKIEENAGKKVAFLTSADIISQAETHNEELQAKYAAVVAELEQAQNEIDAITEKYDYLIQRVKVTSRGDVALPMYKLDKFEFSNTNTNIEKAIKRGES